MQRKAITVQPQRNFNNTVESINSSCLDELNSHLYEGWIIESETILTPSVHTTIAIGYKGLSSVIYILVKN